MAVLLVIPARYASARYPGKPLVALRGAGGAAKSLLQRSWEAARRVGEADRVVVATDDARIRAAAEGFGAEVVMTSAGARNGTERCAEALVALGTKAELVVNLQGDAPLTPPHFVEAAVAALRADRAADVATPVLRCDAEMAAALRADREAGRVGATTAVSDMAGRALYFSKEVIPYSAADLGSDEPAPVFHHVGIYAYRPDALAAYPELAQGALERQEGLEQLRFLENGHPVRCVEVAAGDSRFWELNNPDDVARIEAILAAEGRA